MAMDQVAVEPERVETPISTRGPSRAARRGGGWGKWRLVWIALAGLGAGGYYMVTNGRDRAQTSGHATAAAHGEGGAGGGGLPRVEVVKPKRGGMEMTTSQPGTVHAFEFAKIYAKVSGFVKEP